MYLCVPCCCDACYSVLRVGVRTLYDTLQELHKTYKILELKDVNNLEVSKFM